MQQTRPYRQQVGHYSFNCKRTTVVYKIRSAPRNKTKGDFISPPFVQAGHVQYRTTVATNTRCRPEKSFGVMTACLKMGAVVLLWMRQYPLQYFRIDTAVLEVTILSRFLY